MPIGALTGQALLSRLEEPQAGLENHAYSPEVSDGVLQVTGVTDTL